MKKHSISFLAACAVAFTLPAAAQYTGTSHPDEVAISTSPTAGSAPVDPYARVVPAPAPSPIPAPAPVRPQPAPAQPAPLAAPAPLLPPPPSDGVIVRVAGPSNTLPEGTIVKTRLLQSLSTTSTPEGAEWSAEFVEPLTRDGRVLIPAGAILRGRVTEVRGGKRIHGKAAIHLKPVSVLMPDGTALAMHAQVIDTSLYHSTEVDREGTILRRDHKAEEGGIFAATAGTGAVTGAFVAGPPGALVGAGIGAGVGTALWLHQDRQAEIPQDTTITFELTKSMIFGQQ